MERKVLDLTVLLDANTLYGDLQRDILLSLAEERLYDPLWSEKILDEVESILRENLGLDFSLTRQNMQKAFPKALVKDFENLEIDITFPDSNDLHIVAAALKSSADFIISDDFDFVSENLKEYNLVGMKLDQFLVYIIEAYEVEALAIIDDMRKRRNKIKLLSKSELINRLKEIGLIDTANTMESMHYLE